MSDRGSVVVIGGSSVFGEGVAQHYADSGRRVYLSCRDQARADAIATKIGGNTSGVSLDLTKPHDIAASLAKVEDVENLVLVPIDRDGNTIRNYNIDAAINLVTLKLVGFTTVIHVLSSKMRERGSIVLYGGNATERPYPGSTTVTTINGGIKTMVNTLAVELAPIRVNAIHPAVVGDSPFWEEKPDAVMEGHRARTTTGELVTVADVVDATIFLLENRSITGVNLTIDAGTNRT